MDRFFEHDATEHVRNLLLGAIDAGQAEGTKYFTFNAFNVLLDYDRRLVTIEDEFDGAAMCRVEIAEFARRLRVAPDECSVRGWKAMGFWPLP